MKIQKYRELLDRYIANKTNKNRKIEIYCNKRIYLLFSGNLMNSNYLLEADIDSDYKHIKIRFVLFFERCCFFFLKISGIYTCKRREEEFFLY